MPPQYHYNAKLTTPEQAVSIVRQTATVSCR